MEKLRGVFGEAFKCAWPRNLLKGLGIFAIIYVLLFPIETFWLLLFDFEGTVGNYVLTLVYTALMAILLLVLAQGATKWFYNTVVGGSQKVGNLFYYFRKPKLFAKALPVLLIEGLIGFVFFVGWFVLEFYLVLKPSFYESLFPWTLPLIQISFARLLVTAVLALAAFALYTAVSVRFIVSRYLLVRDDEVGTMESINKGKRYVAGYIGKFVLYMTLFALVSFVIIAVILVVPFIAQLGSVWQISIIAILSLAYIIFSIYYQIVISICMKRIIENNEDRELDKYSATEESSDAEVLEPNLKQTSVEAQE